MLVNSLEGIRYRVSQQLLDKLAKILHPSETVPDNIYTIVSVNDEGIATITWETEEGTGEVTYTEDEVINYINEKNWILV